MAASSVSWDEKKELDLIKEIEIREFLYNSSLRAYKDARWKEAGWAEIGTSLNCPAVECVIKWKKIREKFVKARRKLEGCSAGGSKKLREWLPIYESLTFLVPFIYSRKSGPDEKSNEAASPVLNCESMQGIESHTDEDTDEIIDEDDQSNDVTENVTPPSVGIQVTSAPTALYNSCNPPPLNFNDQSGSKYPSGKKRKREDKDDFTEVFREAVNVYKAGLVKNAERLTINDESSAIARSVEMRLRRFSDKKRALAHKRICDLLFEIEYGTE